MDKSLRDEIAKVAYELYQKRGRGEGRHHEDWIEAEKIVKARHEKAEPEKAVKAVKKESAAESPKEKRTAPVSKASPKKGTAKKAVATKKTE